REIACLLALHSQDYRVPFTPFFFPIF
ncbi:MAG: hypothetical protein RL244_437, partial [Pseudomonadota bacterium]